jgi:nitrite reductase/ring-hydroxylating ferredoxin subunit
MNIIYYLGVILVVGLHLYAAIGDIKLKKERSGLLEDGFILVGDANDIPTDRAKVVNHKGQSIAVFKYDNKLSAVFNYCKHQGGPLGEGKILDGCITCPWHGFQYLPHNGQAPPPFNEKIATFDLKLVGNEIFLNPEAHPEGTDVDPLALNPTEERLGEDFFIGWAADVPLSLSQFLKRSVVAICAVAALMAISLPNLSEELKDSEFTFGDIQEYEGTFHMLPVPRLTIGNEDHLLIDFGKFSASRSIKEYEQLHNVQLDQTILKIEGTPISYNGRNLIELSDQVASIKEHKSTLSISNLEKTDLGSISLKGEILDAKCFFGVMNPGDGPVHKFCAALCIEGGIPAVIYDETIDEYYIIKGENGLDINEQLVPLAGEIVRLSGNSYSINNWRYVDVNSDINRLSFKNVLGENTETLCSIDDQYKSDLK